MSSRDYPDFSIVMPTYNSRRYVDEAIGSVLRQTYANWELLVVDDASTDDTPARLRAAAGEDRRIKIFLRTENGGPAEARNLAIRQASGRFIAFLDSDDIWREDKLERQRAHLAETQAPLVYSSYEKIDAEGRRAGRVVRVPEVISYRRLLEDTAIATCTAVYDSQLVGRVLMPGIRKRQDFGLWLSILRHGGEARGLNEPLAFLRKRAGSVSSNKLSAVYYTWRVYREVEGLSWASSARAFAMYLVRALQKASV